MAARERALPVALVAGAALLCGLYPLSAQAVDPLALPALLAAIGATALVLRKPEYGIAVILALAPLVNLAVGGGKPFQAVVPALAVGTLAYGLMISSTRRLGRETKLIAVAMAIFFVSAVISSAQALAPEEAVADLALITTAIALFGAVTQICVSPQQQTPVIGGAVAGLLIAAVQGIVQSFLGDFSTEGFVAGSEVIGRIQGSFGHPNLYAGYLATLLPLAVAIGINPRFSAPLRSLSVVAAAAAVPALYLTFGRGAIIGLVAGVVIWFALIRPRLAVATVLMLAALALIAAPATLQERFDPQSSGGDVALRQDIWKSSLDIYGERPIFGVGPNNFGTAYERLPATTDAGSQRRLLHQDLLLVPPHPQSIYLQALSERGTLGVITLIGLIAAALTVLWRAAKSRDPALRTLGFGVGIGFTGLLIHGFLEVPLVGEVMLPLFALLAVITAAVERNETLTPGAAQP